MKRRASHRQTSVPSTSRTVFRLVTNGGRLTDPDPDEVVEYVFVAKVDGDDPILSSEHDAWKWRVPKEAVSMLKWQNNINALCKCEAFLAAK